MHVKIFAILSTIIIFLLVIDAIRREKMTFTYAFIWLIFSALALLISVFDKYLAMISNWVGFVLPSNFVFFLFLIFFVVLCLMLTIYVNEQSSKSEKLAQSIAKLEYEIKKLKNRS